MNIPHIILTFLICLFSQTYAREAAIRTCRILFIDRPANAPKTLHLFDGTGSQEVELPSMNLSPLYKLATGDIRLKLLTSKVDDPKEISPDAPSVDIPAKYTDFFLIVYHDPENNITPVKLKAFNMASDDFKIGHTLWINDTDNTIEAKLGQQALSLGPHDKKNMASPSGDTSPQVSGYFHVSFTYQADKNGPFAPITEQQWWHDANSRHIGFITKSGGKLPKIHFFRDFRDSEPAGK
jgi:hypothetical protein